MNHVTQKISALRARLESAAFLVAQPNQHKAAHKEILDALALLTELDVAYSGGTTGKSSSVSDVKEINKVQGRLKRWAEHPHQMNSRILTAYLKLEKQGVNPITKNLLREAVGKDSSFSKNFPQMKKLPWRRLPPSLLPV